MYKSNKQAGNAVVIGLLVVVVLAVVGFAGYTVMNKNDDDTKDSAMNMSTNASTGSVTAKASDLRSNLVTLGVEHMTLTASAVDAALDGTKDANAKGAALYANGESIGAAVGSVYGKDAEATFNKVWKLHLDEFVKYAVASSKGDAAAKKAALDAIDSGYTKPLSAYLAKANPNLPEATLNSVLGDHVAMTAEMIDSHVAGKYEDEQKQLTDANKHIEGIFSTLAGAIVKQYPEKFAE